MSTNVAPIEVFCSYADKDASLLEQLEIHASQLRRHNLISTWHRQKLVAGSETGPAIDARLNRASLILLLVSPDYLASDYCYEDEMQRAIERHEADQARVVPIILRPCDWTDAPFARLQSLPLDDGIKVKPVTQWPDRDTAWQNVVSSLRRVIQDMPLLTGSASRAVLPKVWNIPYPRNTFFTGRDDLLTQLHTQLRAGQATAISQPHAVSGLGGIGKTQLAIEYAYRYHREYEAVLWAPAASPEMLASSYSTIATLLNLPERNASEQEVITQAVKRWLQTHDKWLLILDNADNLSLLPPYLPPTHTGHILLTTRAWDMQRLAQRIEVQTLADDQAALFLLRRAALAKPDTALSQVSIDDSRLATRIAQELGGLPLALDQAGAYLEATGMSLSQYREVYRQQRQVLLSERRALVPDHSDPVATTWSLSFQHVEEQNTAAADLLRLCAYLAPDAIPESILVQGAPHLGSLLAPVAEDPFKLAQAVEALRAYSLIQRDPRTQTLLVHRLVQAVLQDSMESEAEQEWKRRVVMAVNASCPNVQDVRQWPACEQWLPHALMCATWIEQENMVLVEAALLMNNAAYYLDDRARYSEAEPLYVRALKIREEQLGADHPDTATSLNNLAGLYESQGKYSEAEPVRSVRTKPWKHGRCAAR